MECKPPKQLGLLTGAIIGLTLIGMDIYLLRATLAQPVGLSLYFTALLFLLGVPLTLVFAYWFLGMVTLEYRVDRNALTIGSAAFRWVIPLEAVRSVIPGHEATVVREFRGVGWPGYLRGEMRLRTLGRLWVHSTEPLARQVVVVTDTGCFGISPQMEGFDAALARHRALGPLREVRPGAQRTGLAAWPVWSDWRFWGLAAITLALNAVLWGVVSARYPGLPERLSIRLGVGQQVASIIPKANLIVVSVIGAATLTVNTLLGFLLHHWERLATYLLMVVALAIQLVLWAAAIGILGF